ncbi:acid-sensing ion channel 4-like [Eriocheir sinensis]|uniref:acid-sensing ion channel 4-like n=1 Tax=Eriocheir sinensis TaxID=95602 RepID=UPI0021C9B09C|nr:acid-sensing ion channel 4-like [Eriocheir sinensis]
MIELRDYRVGGEGVKPAKECKTRPATTSPPGSRFAEISIAGMSRACVSSCPRAQRGVWTLALLTCTALMTAQVWDRLTYYLSTPVTVNVRVTRNQTLRFPIVSFCNKNRFNMTAVRQMQEERAERLGETNSSEVATWDIPDLLDDEDMDAAKVWTRTSHGLDRMVKECWFTRGKRCEEVGSWSTIHTVLGICYQYRVNDPVETSGIFNNMYLLLHDKEPQQYNGDNGFKILIHDPRDDPVIDLRTHGTTINEGWGKDVRVAVREFKTISRHRWPCVSNTSYSSSQCISRCFLTALHAHTQCLMPYMHDIDGRQCNTSEEYRNSTDMETRLLFFGGWKHSQCECLKQCNEDIYSIYTEAAKTNKDSAKLRVFFQDLTFDEVSEEIAYGTIALLCDIGGTLGLLLGASVLTFMEFLEVVIVKVLWR